MTQRTVGKRLFQKQIRNGCPLASIPLTLDHYRVCDGSGFKTEFIVGWSEMCLLMKAGSALVPVMDVCCHDFEPSTSEDPPCREVIHMFPLVGCGSQEREVPALVSFSSLDHGLKLRGKPPKSPV
ncbi:hypothetical protein TNCV_3761 [Trichonephila clavipes]|nr:hypothetical protein TNCV_3761 [Trichonephila clavipes]